MMMETVILLALLAVNLVLGVVEPGDHTLPTLAYVTRPPLILLTHAHGLNSASNRNHSSVQQRRFFVTEITSSFRTTPSNSAISSTTIQAETTSFPTTTFAKSTTTSPIDASTVVSSVALSSSPANTSSSSTIEYDTATVGKITSRGQGIKGKDTAQPDEDQHIENAEHYGFEAEASPISPTTSIKISFRRSSKYDKYQVNCTDVDEVSSGNHFSSSFVIDSIPFVISGLLPGHLYTLTLSGIPVKKNRKRPNEALVNLGTIFATTDPEVPRIDAHNISVTTNSISFAADKQIGALQDYFLLTYSVAGDTTTNGTSVATTWNVNVTDIVEQPKVEFYIGGLIAGTVYNVAVTSFRRGKASKKWNAIIITTPLPPTNVRVVSSFPNEIILAWDRPAYSGVDSYYVAYRNEFRPNASEIDTRDLILKLDNGIIPGEKYYVDIYSVKGGNAFSEPVYLEIITKPLPPVSLSLSPNYGVKLFEANVALAPSQSSHQDACILQYFPMDDHGSGSFNSVNNLTAVPQLDYCHWFLPLTPGINYKFQIWTARGTSSTSDPFTNSTTVEPAFDAEILGVTILPEEKSFEVKWNTEALLEYWPTLAGKDGNLSASVLNSYQVTKMLNPLATSSGLLVDGLTSGSCYTVEIYASAFGIISRNRTRYRVRTQPSEIMINLANFTATTAMLNLKAQSPLWTLDSSCRVVIMVKDDGNHTVLNKTLFNSQTASSSGSTLSDGTSYIFVTNLKAFSRYGVSGIHSCGNDGDDCEVKQRNLLSMNFETGQGVPGPVRNIRIDVQTPSVAVLHWDPPDQANGVLSGYLITVYPATANNEEPWNISWPAAERTFTVQNLTGGLKYSFDVRAQTPVGLGLSSLGDTPAKELPSKTMLVWAPPKPFGRPEILYNTVRETDFSLRFNLSMFSTRNGMLEGYSVIVVEGDGARDFVNANSSVGTWFDVQSFNVWPAYAALSKPLSRTKTLDARSITEVIGVDMDCAKRAEETKRDSTPSSISSTQFCNGPLRPGRKYRVKLRVYTSGQLYSDSDLSDVVITSAETGSAAGTVLAVILAFLVTVAVAIGILFVLRARGVDPLRPCFKAKSRLLSMRGDTTDCGITPQSISVTAAIGGRGGAARRQRSLRERTGIDGRLDKLPNTHQGVVQLPTILPSANTEISRPVLKSDFGEHVRLMSADSDFRFSEEFEELKQVGRNEPCAAADVPCNRNKNRFTNILPYDHSRVKLAPVDDDEGSDYINASYISGYNSPREYIAAQGPLPSTRDDFWRMMWEQNCPAIVNLTRCIEKGREKCDQYWPSDTDPVYYGDVEVLLMNETRFPDWTVREFKVSHTDQSRTVRHFHFTAWPDFGVPERPQILVKFVRALRARVPAADASGPIVVHCSAGVGRSGTLIAIDRIIQHLELHDFIDIYGIVYEMRKERAWMVQTEQQYIFIHQCILCVLEGQEIEENVTLYAPRPAMVPPVEIHQNPAFEDDEGIAESGV